MPVKLTKYKIRVKRETTNTEETLEEYFKDDQACEYFAKSYEICFKAKILGITHTTETKINLEKDFDKNGFPLKQED